VRQLYEPHALTLAQFLCVPLPRWAPVIDPKRRSDAWTTVEGFRSGAHAFDRITRHVSLEATAAHLESHDEDRL
jgi:hypothetical protein